MYLAEFANKGTILNTFQAVVKAGVSNASSISALLLTTDAAIAEAPKDEKPACCADGSCGHAH